MLNKRFLQVALSIIVLLMLSCSKAEQSLVSIEIKNRENSAVGLVSSVENMKPEQVLNQQTQARELQERDNAFKSSEKDLRAPQADEELIMNPPLILSFDKSPLFLKHYTLAIGEAHSLLPNLFTRHETKPDVSFKGRLLIDKKSKDYLEAVEGLEVSVNIKTH